MGCMFRKFAFMFHVLVFMDISFLSICVKLCFRNPVHCIKEAANKAIEMLIELNKCDLLDEVTKRTGEEGFKVSGHNLPEDIKKHLYRGSDSMTSTKGGKSQRYRFVALSNISEQNKMRIIAVKNTFVSYFNSAVKQIQEEVAEEGRIFMLGMETER